MRQNSLFKFAIIFLIMTGCGGGKNTMEESTEQGGSSTRNQPQTPDNYFINNSSNEEVAAIFFGEVTAIRNGSDEYFKSCGDEDKCKYKSSDKSIVFEIRYKDDGFKLRNEQGDLIWKIKIRDDKIKVADNEEMEDGYEIKKKGNKASVTFKNEQIGTVDFGSPSVPVLVTGKNQQYTVTGRNKNLAAGILIIEKMTEIHRVLVLAEAINHKH